MRIRLRGWRRTLLALLVVMLAAATAAGFLPGGRPRHSAAGRVQPLTAATATATAAATAGSVAQPRIPLAALDSAKDTVAQAAPLVDPACPAGCIARVKTGSADGATVLWRRDDLAYVAADTRAFSQLRAPTVAWAGLDTLSLYVLSHVRSDQDALVRQFGTIRDTAADVRLLEAKRVPLPVDDLYAAGIWVEKLPPDPNHGPGSQPRDIPQTIAEFSRINASDGVLGDREFDDPGTIMAAEYLFRRYSRLGFKVRYVDFTGPGGRHEVNVVADPPGGRVEPAVMVTGHYDSISPPGQPAPGADDNGSGTAALLELAARVAAAGFSPPVSFVSFGAEEPGLYGSDAYVHQLLAAGVKLKAVINIDAIGIPNDGNVEIVGNDDSRWIYRDLVALSSDAYWLKWMESDYFLSDDEHFRRAGYTAILFTTHIWGTEPVHHTPNDRIENVDMHLVADLTDLIWSWLKQQR